MSRMVFSSVFFFFLWATQSLICSMICSTFVFPRSFSSHFPWRNRLLPHVSSSHFFSWSPLAFPCFGYSCCFPCVVPFFSATLVPSCFCMLLHLPHFDPCCLCIVFTPSFLQRGLPSLLRFLYLLFFPDFSMTIAESIFSKISCPLESGAFCFFFLSLMWLHRTLADFCTP